MAKYPTKLGKDVRTFLSDIGKIGGQTSRRHLTRRQAKQMVAIREFKKAAMKAGKMELARKRIPLPKEKLKLPPPPPAVAPQRWLHHPKP
jgi:hypothetical protein